MSVIISACVPMKARFVCMFMRRLVFELALPSALSAQQYAKAFSQRSSSPARTSFFVNKPRPRPSEALIDTGPIYVAQSRQGGFFLAASYIVLKLKSPCSCSLNRCSVRESSFLASAQCGYSARRSFKTSWHSWNRPSSYKDRAAR